MRINTGLKIVSNKKNEIKLSSTNPKNPNTTAVRNSKSGRITIASKKPKGFSTTVSKKRNEANERAFTTNNRKRHSCDKNVNMENIVKVKPTFIKYCRYSFFISPP